MSSARLRDWQTRLALLLRERRAMPFAWGLNDCCTFPCDGVLAMTGGDPADGLRSHRTFEEAQQVLLAHDGVRGLADARLGPRIEPAFARIGDVGLVRIDRGLLGLALRAGDGWMVPGANGLSHIPLNAARLAWRT